MKKELLIAAKFDTSDFDKAVESMQKKLKDIYAPSDMVRAQAMTSQRLQSMGLGGTLSQPTQEAYIKATQQSRRELDQLIKEQAAGQEKLGKMIAQRIEKLKEMKDHQMQMVKGSKEELEIKEKISRVEENNFRLRQVYMQRDQALNQAMQDRNKVAPRDIPGLIDSFRYGGFRHGMSQIPGAFRQNPLGMGGTALSAIGGLTVAGAELYRDMAGVPVRTEAAMGNAVQGTMGRDVANIYGRRTAFEMMFGQERARASQQAMDAMRANRNADMFGLAGNTALVAGGAMLAAKGAGVGAGIGSAVPGLGTAACGIVGSLPGVIAAGRGLYGMLGDERQRSLMLSPFSTTANNRYQSILAEQMSRDYETSLESQKRQNPFKTMAVQEYEQNFMRNLNMQRMMGLTNEGFYGDSGFLRQSLGKGFTPEMAMEMAQSIQGAGGSTRGARNASFGLELQRGFDLSNASQVLGTLSGGLGSSETTKQATIKILAEGMKQGLDGSDFAEENRRFTQATAEIISRSGARGEGDFDRIASSFGRFLGENTNKGIDAAKSAYEQYQQISSSVSGPRGVMRAAGFLADDKLSQLTTMQKQALMQVPEESLTEDNMLVQGAADSLGLTPQEVVQRIRKTNEGAVSRFGSTDKARDRLRAKGVDMTRITDPSYRSTLDEQSKKDAFELATSQTVEFGFRGNREMQAFATGVVGKPEQFGPAVGKEAVAARLGAESGRMEDNTIKAMAGDASTVLKNFNEMRGEMDAAAKSAAAFTDQVREMNAALVKALEEARTSGNKQGIMDTLKGFMQQNIDRGQVQPQSGKQSK